MKRYHDIVGDGGSRVLEQVAEQRTRIADGLAGVRHLVAVGSGKGGVGKSTLTLHLAGALRARGLRIAILDADFNGPSQARMAGVQGALFVPGSHKVALPRTSNGIGVFSMGSLIPESEALEFESAAHGESHTWRATREFALLGEILGVVRVGGARSAAVRPAARSRADRAVRRFSRPANVVRAGDDPFRGRAGRRRALGRGAVEGPQSPPRLRREHERLLLPRLRRDQAALRLARAGGASEIPCLGTVPFDPELARHCDRGIPLADLSDTPVGRALDTSRSDFWTASNRTTARSLTMKFLCVPCDSPMKLQTVGRPSAARCRSSTRALSAATRWRCSPMPTRPRSFSRSACESAPPKLQRRRARRVVSVRSPR